jgi:hypothetical protein
MKKTLALLLAIAAATSFGASFDWGTGSVKASFGDTVFNTAGNLGTMYLVQLTDTKTVSDLFTATASSLTPAASVSSALPATSGSNANKGKVKGTFDDAAVANGNVFGAYFVYNDGEKDWYNFSSTTFTVSGVSIGNEILDPAVFAFNFTTKTSDAAGTDVTAGGGWYSLKTGGTVPEPATGALALAGVALLFKRRKA